MESKKFSKLFEAVFLTSHPKGPKMGITDTAKYLHESDSCNDGHTNGRAKIV